MRIKRLPVVGLLAVVGVVAVVGVLQSAWSGAAEVAVPVSADDKAVLHRAEERLIKQCMTAAGFEYYEIAPKSSTERRFPYVVDDVAWARANGYAAPKPKTAAPSSAYLKSLSPERQQAWRVQLLGTGRQISVELTGGQRLWTSDNGCIADARRALYDDLPRWFTARRITDKLPYFVAAEVRADPAYAEAMKDWAGCVRRHGYDADDPGELASLVAGRTNGAAEPAIRSAQIAATVTEATCANSSSMVGTVRALEAEYLPKITAEHRRELQDLNVLEQAALPRAESVLGSR